MTKYYIKLFIYLEDKEKFSHMHKILHTTLIKKFPEFIQKIQNTVLFIKNDIVPFKVLPIDCNALMRLIQFSKYFWNSIDGSRLRFFHYLLSAASP